MSQDYALEIEIELANQRRAVEALQVQEAGPIWTYLTAPLTHASWTNAHLSTTAKTLIDLSAVFGVPVGVKAVLVRVVMQDSGAGSADYSLLLSPNNTSASGLGPRCMPANDRWNDWSGVIPCNSDGDIYYQVYASGSGSMDVYLEIWGYAK